MRWRSSAESCSTWLDRSRRSCAPCRRRARAAPASSRDRDESSLSWRNRPWSGPDAPTWRLSAINTSRQPPAGATCRDIDHEVGEVLEEDAGIDAALDARGNDVVGDLAPRLIGVRQRDDGFVGAGGGASDGDERERTEQAEQADAARLQGDELAVRRQPGEADEDRRAGAPSGIDRLSACGSSVSNALAMIDHSTPFAMSASPCLSTTGITSMNVSTPSAISKRQRAVSRRM